MMRDKWRQVPLSDIAEITMGNSPPGESYNTAGHGTPLINGPVEFSEDPLGSTIKSKWTTAPTKHCRQGDLLICVRGSTTGRTNVAAFDACIGRGVAAVRALEYQPFLNRFLCSRRQYIFTSGKGSTFPSISQEQLACLLIPLPPLAEQKRIAAILDAADALRAKRRESIEQLDQLLQATFLEMFGDPVKNTKEWNDSVLLGEVADITSGLTKGRKLRNQSTREVPYLAVVNVQDRRLVLDPLKTIDATNAEIDKYRLLRNDLLLTEGGDRDKLGRGTLWQDELPECIHQNHIFRVRLHDKRWIPVFLSWLVGSDRGKRYFLSQAKQTTGIASINLSQLKRFPLLLPPLQLQHRFASISEVVELQKVRLKKQCAELDALFESLQVRAFSGELCSGPALRRHASA